MIKVRRLSSNAKLPTKKASDSVCLQLYSAHDVTVPSHGKALVQTDLEMEVPFSTFGRIVNKPGLSVDNEIDVYSPIIEHSGNVGVVLYNHGDNDFIVATGGCVAQLVVEQAVIVQVREGSCVYS
ncbi:Deoxyuridine 5'-triphosphate nucleotidohydrolase [Tribonema minus]|uniref:dUTP diphosphatase n=1 Tax=Tribonema minus TaxID=303371 RepID=A0A835YZ59_9STRA|nr:Deoxyuridine 5'-triphosphate nucleotidohydrolase [Tribonema minus]